VKEKIQYPKGDIVNSELENTPKKNKSYLENSKLKKAMEFLQRQGLMG